MLKFSIVTIEKEYPDGLERTLQSIAHQVIPDGMEFSHLICEGTPGSAHKLIRDLNLVGISKVCSSIDTGIYNAMNRGLSTVTKGWVLFLNAGDSLTNRDVLSHINQVLRDAHAPVVQFKSNYSDGTTRPFKPYTRTSLYLGRNMHIHPALCMNLDVIRDVRFDEDFKIAADYKMMNELIKTFRFQFSNIVISNFEPGGVSSRSKRTLIREMNLVRVLVSPRLLPMFLVKVWNNYFSYNVSRKMRVK